MNARIFLFLFLPWAAAALTPGCAKKKSDPENTRNSLGELRILAVPEIRFLMPVMEEFERKTGARISMDYAGSADIQAALDQKNPHYDAVWPAHSIWLSRSGGQRRAAHVKSVMMSPVVVGIRKSLAEKWGFTTKEVRIADILAVVKSRKCRFQMAPAARFHSGASLYLAFLRALSGSPQLTAKSIRMESLRANAADLLSGVEQMESAGFLKDFLLAGDHDAVAAYEAILLEIDRELARRKREPFFLTYIVDATVTANFPLGFIENPEHPEREALFLRFRDYLLSPPVQRRLAAFGWRTETGDFPDAGGLGIGEDWGLNPNRTLSELRLPAPDVFGEALDLYRTGFRKPAFTFFCLDFSGSMRGKGETELKQAMRILLHPEDFARYGIDTGRRDRLQILAFSDRILGKWESDAASPDGLLPIDDALQILSPAGNGDLHACLLQALSFLLETPGMDAYAPAIVLMTDGRSPALAGSALEWERRLQESRRKIPVFTVLFGNAAASGPEALARLTGGRVFDGRIDPLAAFRKIREIQHDAPQRN